MVLEETKTIYSCPYCGDRFDDLRKAESCRDNCVEYDDVEEEFEDLFICEICGKDYDDKNDAYDCENKHKKSNDLVYGSYIFKKKQEELRKAQAHPAQTRLSFEGVKL